MMMSMRMRPSTMRPSVGARKVTLIARPARSAPVARSTPAEVAAKLEAALKEAQDCSKETATNCAPQWDEVEELASTKSHMKDAAKADPKLSDPLEQFCEGHPDADECRVYED